MVLPIGDIGDAELGGVKRFVAEMLLRILAFLGLAFGGGSAAATADIEELRQLSLLDNPDVPVGPPELALGRLRGVQPPFDYDTEARRTGIDKDRLAFLEEITGEPPGLMQLLDAYRRGIIDQATLERGIRQSRVRNEWIPTVEALRFQPPGPGQVLAAWIETHLSDDEAHRLLLENGVDTEHHQWLYETEGRPPAPEMMLNLLNRRFMTEEQVRQAVRESDIKNKYIDAIIESRKYIPPVRTIGVLIANGALTDERALELYAENGVRPEDAAAYVASAHHSKTASHKHLAVSEIATLYEDRYLDRQTCTDSLVALGYDANDANLVLEVSDLRRWRKFLDAAVNRVHTLFVSHKMDAATAQNTLDQLGVEADQKADLLALWQLERNANVRLLTEAQVIRAFKLGNFTEDQAHGRLLEMGYSADDATVLIENA